MPTLHSPTKITDFFSPKRKRPSNDSGDEDSQSQQPPKITRTQTETMTGEMSTQPEITNLNDLAKLITSQHQSLTTRFDVLAESHKQTTKRVEDLEAAVELQNDVISQLTREKNYLLDEIRKQNIIIHGLPENETNPDQLLNTATNYISQLGVTAEVDNPYRMGKPVPGKIRPVKIRITRQSDREKILKKKMHTNAVIPGSYITADLCLSTRLARKKALEARNLSQGQGHSRNSNLQPN